MDAFEIRMALVGHLRKLNASQASVRRVVDHLASHASCAGDLWKCLLQECRKGSLNHRLNILYMLDELISDKGAAVYRAYIAHQLPEIVDMVVPDERNGIINLLATLQILQSWRVKRLLEPEMMDALQNSLESRRVTLSRKAQEGGGDTPRTSDKEILRRFEEDRERHKRLREEIWVLPITDFRKEEAMNYVTPSPAQSNKQQAHKSNLLTLSGENDKSLDVEFDNVWESTSDYNEDDVEEMLDDLNNLHSAQVA